MRSYYSQMECAIRWQNAIDYASPMTAWTSEMFKILNECDGDKLKAAALLKKRRSNRIGCGMNTLTVRDYP